jgi:hypothetical protein
VAADALSDPEWLMLVLVLIGHQRLAPGRCGCGWREPEHSHARHIADTYAHMIANAAWRDQRSPARATARA